MVTSHVTHIRRISYISVVTAPSINGFKNRWRKLCQKFFPISPIDWTLICPLPFLTPAPPIHHPLAVIISICYPNPCSIYVVPSNPFGKDVHPEYKYQGDWNSRLRWEKVLFFAYFRPGTPERRQVTLESCVSPDDAPEFRTENLWKNTFFRRSLYFQSSCYLLPL